MFYFFLQLLKSKSEGEVGQGSSGGHVASTVVMSHSSSLMNDRNSTTKVGSMHHNFNCTCRKVHCIICISFLGITADAERDVKPVRHGSPETNGFTVQRSAGLIRNVSIVLKPKSWQKWTKSPHKAVLWFNLFHWLITQQWPDTISRGWSVTTQLRSLCADLPPSVNHSILHHQPPPSGSQAYDTLSLESSDSLETSVSTGNSACTPERWETGKPTVSMGTLQSAPSPRKKRSLFFVPVTCFVTCPLTWLQQLLPWQPIEVWKLSCLLPSCCFGFPGLFVYFPALFVSVIHAPSSVCCSACGLEAQRMEEMEKLLKEAQQEKARLIENRVGLKHCCCADLTTKPRPHWLQWPFTFDLFLEIQFSWYLYTYYQQK